MNILPFHISFMVAACVAMLSGICAARFFGKKKWWFRTHKTLNLAAVGFLVLGLLSAVIMVQSSGGPHLRVPHGILGLITILVSAAIPSLGFAIFKEKDKTKIPAREKTHRISGRSAAVLMTATVISGLALIGVF